MIKFGNIKVRPAGIKKVYYGNNLVYEKLNVSTVKLVIGYTLSNPINIRYSMDGLNWTPWLSGASGESSTITPTGTSIDSSFTGLVLTDNLTGKKVAISSTTSTLAENGSRVKFVMTGSISASGNVNSMINYGELSEHCYYGLFEGCESLKQAPSLPSTSLKINCYRNMFANCTSLTEAPQLPSTSLEASCYQYMFFGCSALTEAPNLPATTLRTNCYSRMFAECTSLTTPPNLLNKTLADYCYYFMFQGCTSLKVNENGTEGTPFLNNISRSDITSQSMFMSTGGEFKGTPTAGNTYKWYN